MRILHKTGLTILAASAALAFFSCRTTDAAQSAPPAVRTTAGAPAEKPVEGPAPKQKFSRIEFGEQLEQLIAGGRIDDALALFDSVPESERGDFRLGMLRLSVLISAGRTDDALVLANELEARQPRNPEILYVQAILAGARNDNPGRISYLNRVFQIEPDHSGAMTALGLDLFGKKDYDQAKTWLVKAVAADPDNADALLALARVYYMTNQLPQAEDTLNLAIDKDPDYSVPRAERARVRSETDNLPGALRDIQDAVERDPKVYGHWIDYGNYLISAAKREEARDAFSKAIALEPGQYLAYIYRAGLNDDLGNTDGAISDYTAICRLFPQYYFAAESLGILLWGKGDYAGSRAAFLSALEYNPKNVSYALMYTLCYYRAGMKAEAKKFMANYITTLDRSTTEYFLCRLFVDLSGDADVLGRVMKEKNANTRNRMLFYLAEYYDLFQSKTVAQKYYLEIVSVTAPTFFEYRLSKWAMSQTVDSGEAPAKG